MSQRQPGRRIDGMQSVAYAAPLLPGQEEAHRVALASCHAGARREAYRDARRRAGITREAVWAQPVPGGSVAVVFVEADDLMAAYTVLGTSPEPFDRWYREQVRLVHGISLERAFTGSELLLDFDTSRL